MSIAMQSDMKKLLTFMFDDERSHLYQAALNMLSAYVDAELDGQDAAIEFPEVKMALEFYPSLREIYEDARELLYLERQDALFEPTTIPDFDSSYLVNIIPPPPIWQVVERAGKEVRELFKTLRVALSAGEAFFEQLPSPLVAEWEMVMMPSRSIASPAAPAPLARVPVLSLQSPEHDLSLRLTVTPPQSEERAATLTVEVMQISSKQFVHRCRVVLRDANYRMLESHFTEPEGRVSFTKVSLGNYVLEVKFQGRVWQLPIEVTWAEEEQVT